MSSATPFWPCVTRSSFSSRPMYLERYWSVNFWSSPESVWAERYTTCRTQSVAMKHPKEQSFIKYGLMYKTACPCGHISFTFSRFLTSVPLREMTEPGHGEGENFGTEGMQAGLRDDRVGPKELSGGGRQGWVGPGRAGRIKEDLRWPPPAVSRTLLSPTGRGSTTSWVTISLSIVWKQPPLLT